MCLFSDWTWTQNWYKEQVIPEDRIANVGCGDRSAQAFGLKCNAKQSLASNPQHADNRAVICDGAERKPKQGPWLAKLQHLNGMAVTVITITRGRIDSTEHTECPQKKMTNSGLPSSELQSENQFASQPQRVSFLL